MALTLCGNGQLLSERSQIWAKERTTAQALAELAAARIPAAPVLSPQQVLAGPDVRSGKYQMKLQTIVPC